MDRDYYKRRREAHQCYTCSTILDPAETKRNCSNCRSRRATYSAKKRSRANADSAARKTVKGALPKRADRMKALSNRIGDLLYILRISDLNLR